MSDGSIKISTEIDVKEALNSLKRIEDKLGDVQEKGNSSSSVFSKLGSGIGKLAKIGAVGLGAVATGTLAIGKSALDSYASYEQLVGGVDTLFKDSSKQVQEYAKNAYKTANMSANDYMETVTSFSASLIASLDGDTKKATEYSNRAITDMSDNANKMGSSLESLQNAYQGFAKQNYTMLDNLKLGYGGTKEEMARLISDASKMTDIQKELGVTVDGSSMSFGNIINAISVMQKKLDITGTTAKESASTIEGSINTMKSAWSNMVTALANKDANLGEVMGNLVESILQVGKNVGAVIPTIIQSIGTLVGGLATNLLPQLLTGVTNTLSTMLPLVINTLTTIIQTVGDALPQLATVLVQAIPLIVNAIVELLPMLLELGLNLIVTLGQGIAQSLPTLIPIIVDLLIGLCDTFIANMDMLFDVAIEIIFALVQGIITALPTLIEEVPRIINEFSSKLYSFLPKLLKAGIDLLIEIGKGLIQALPTFIKNIPEILKAILNVWTLFNWSQMGKNAINWIKDGLTSLKETLPTTLKNIGTNALNWLKDTFLGGTGVGKGLISNLMGGISSLASGLLGAIGNLGTSVLTSLKNFFSWSNMASIGKNLVQGIWNGISNMTGWIIDKIGGFADSVVDSICGFFGIFSPSRVMRDEVGKMLVKGIGVGVEVETPKLEKDIEANMSDLVYKMNSTVAMESSRANTIGASSSIINSRGINGGIAEGSTFTIVNQLDGEVIGEATYEIVDRKLAVVGRSLR